MPLVSMRELLDHAAENGYGIPAYNVNNLEQVQAVMEAAKETGAPVILQASAGARKYAGESFIKHLIQAAVEAYPQIPLVMHQDHGQSPDVCKGAINLGFSSVMMALSAERGSVRAADRCSRGVTMGQRGSGMWNSIPYFGGRGHHGLHLLEVVHVVRWNAVAVFSGVVQQLAH